MTTVSWRNTIAYGMAIMLLSITGVAQEKPDFIGGNAMGIVSPQGNIGSSYEIGILFYGHLDYNYSNNIVFRLDVGKISLSGDEKEYTDANGVVQKHHPVRELTEISAGARIQFLPVYVEARGGYFFGFNHTGYIPAIGLRFGKFDLQTNFAIIGKDELASFRVSYYWAE